MKNREQIVKDLVNTFNDRDALHEAYKEKMKEVIATALCEFLIAIATEPETDAGEWTDEFVETRFKAER